MLSRRLLRVKVVQMVYAFYKTGETSVAKTEKQLFHSIAKSHELYHLFLLLLVELHTFAVNRIEFGKNKRRPTHEDLYPNTKFIENLFLKQLAENKSLLKYIEQNKISWVNNEDVIKNIFKAITSSDLYKDYMDNDEGNDYEKDKKFVAKLFEKVIAPVDDLYAALEEMSIYWNDEAEFIISMVIKTIKTFEQDKGVDQELLPEFKDKEDKDFVKKLLRKSLVNGEQNRDLIKKYTKNWDFERVAFMDVVIMQVAIAELLEFREIPARVTLNEYIEIAKHYSTSKSGVFINGIIDKIVEQMIKEGKITDTEKKAAK
jgi:N utilization substance protein B